MKIKLTLIILAILYISCSDDSVDPMTPDVVVEGEVKEEEVEQENLPDEEIEEEIKVVSFDVSVLVKKVNSDPNQRYVLDFIKGEPGQDIESIVSLETTYDIGSLFTFDNRDNKLYFWEFSRDKEVFEIDVTTKEIQQFSNTDGLTIEELQESSHYLYPIPTLNSIVTMDSQTIVTDGVFTYENSLRIYNQETQIIEVMELPDVNEMNGSFNRYRIDGDIYMYYNNYLSEWKAVDLMNKEILANFTMNGSNQTNFTLEGSNVYFADGKSFNINTNQYGEDFEFPGDLGFPDMVNAQVQSQQIFFKSDFVTKDNSADSGIVLFDFQTRESKKILVREIQAQLYEYFLERGTVFNEINQAYYDFETEIIALTFTTNYPEFGVLFIDFDFNILGIQNFSGLEPVKIIGHK